MSILLLRSDDYLAVNEILAQSGLTKNNKPFNFPILFNFAHLKCRL